jgi:protein-tyrosine phosphatase
MGGTTVVRADALRVLLVCTANICRSPIAEHLLARAVDVAGLPWSVSSAGVAAQDGRPMHAHTAQVLQSRGFATDSWSSRRLTAEFIDDADLVLTATTDHRRQVVTVAPRAAPRTFTLLQFARLTKSAGPPPYEDTDAETFAEWAVRARGSVQPVAAHKDDIADPIGRSLRVFRACAARIDSAIEHIVVVPVRVK